MAINKRSSSETKTAVRLLVDYNPLPLDAEAAKVVAGAPRYALIRKADKAFRRALGG